MKDQMKKEAQKINDKLFNDVEKIKKEKIIIKRDIIRLKKQLQQIKEEEIITKKELKMIKDEVRKYITNQMKRDAQKIAGKLFDDVEKIKKEKVIVKRDITMLKKQLQQIKEDMYVVKEDINIEIERMEEMMNKKATELLRFGNLDFS